MVLGNLLHMLFQHAIKNRKYEKSELHSALIDLLKRKQIINQLYEANLDEEFILKETSVYLSTIEKWLHEHIKLPSSNKSNDPKSAKNFQIASVCDIEESIWSPKFGTLIFDYFDFLLIELEYFLKRLERQTGFNPTNRNKDIRL